MSPPEPIDYLSNAALARSIACMDQFAPLGTAHLPTINIHRNHPTTTHHQLSRGNANQFASIPLRHRSAPSPPGCVCGVLLPLLLRFCSSLPPTDFNLQPANFIRPPLHTQFSNCDVPAWGLCCFHFAAKQLNVHNFSTIATVKAPDGHSITCRLIS